MKLWYNKNADEIVFNTTENSQMVITGDLTQIDLAKPQDSGLLHASKILKNLLGIGFCYFDSSDIVRHALVEKIILAYNDHK